jgi:hypothetical protein
MSMYILALTLDAQSNVVYTVQVLWIPTALKSAGLQIAKVED